MVEGSDTYTILVTDFLAPVRLPGGHGGEARIDLRLTVDHPGPGFADDIGSVMSYEAYILALRRLCAEGDGADARRLAETAAERILALPKVHAVKVNVKLRPVPPDENVIIAFCGDESILTFEVLRVSS